MVGSSRGCVEFASRLLLGIGLLSLAVAAIFLLTQRNYKRMLAYSSVEHIGVICLGLGFGSYGGTFGALLKPSEGTIALNGTIVSSKIGHEIMRLLRNIAHEQFESKAAPEHYHFTCISCRQVIEFESPLVEQLRRAVKTKCAHKFCSGRSCRSRLF